MRPTIQDVLAMIESPEGQEFLAENQRLADLGCSDAEIVEGLKVWFARRGITWRPQNEGMTVPPNTSVH